MARVRRATGAGLPGLEPGDGCQAFPLVVRGMTHPPTVNNNSASLSPGDLGSPIVPGNRHFGVLSLLPACAVTQRYVCLLGLSKWTGPKVSCPVGALVHRGRVGSFDVGYTGRESLSYPPSSVSVATLRRSGSVAVCGGWRVSARGACQCRLSYEKARAKTARQTG